MTDRGRIHFSVVVPTKNRAEMLRHSLRTVLAQDYPDLTLIVSDNCSTDNTKEVVLGFGDSRVRYVHPGRPLSMREHWEFALGHVTQGWLTFMGDDDGLMPGALGRVRDVVTRTGVQALTSSWCRYTWPSPALVHSSQLILPVTRGVQIRESRRWLSRVMSGAWRYIELPYLYTGGFVSYAVIRDALARKPTFFNSINPDIYSGLAIASLIDRYAYLGDPIALRGTSAHSTGASSLGGSDNPAPKQDFIRENARHWHPALQDERVPLSLQLCVYEAYLQSAFLRSTGRGAATHDPALIRPIISLAGEKERPSMIDYVQRILGRAAGVSASARYLPGRFDSTRLRHYLIEMRRVLNSMRIDTLALGAHDVYDAAVVAKSTYARHHQKRGWRIRRLALAIRDYRRLPQTNAQMPLIGG